MDRFLPIPFQKTFLVSFLLFHITTRCIVCRIFMARQLFFLFFLFSFLFFYFLAWNDFWSILSEFSYETFSFILLCLKYIEYSHFIKKLCPSCWVYVSLTHIKSELTSDVYNSNFKQACQNVKNIFHLTITECEGFSRWKFFYHRKVLTFFRLNFTLIIEFFVFPVHK